MASRIGAIFFIEKHFLSFGMLVSVSRRVLSSFRVPYRFIFFNYHLIFCAHLHFLGLAPKSCLLCFLPHRGRGSHLASRFVKLLSKCRFSPFPPYFSQSASLPGFVKLLNVGKPVYEICFFFANRTFHLLLLESFCV